MAEKKIPCRFTIGFNPGDPAHRQTAEILNQQGRRKAQFLVNAVLHYIHCPETPDLPELRTEQGRGLAGQEDIETLIIHILEERGYFKDLTSPAVNTEAIAAGGLETGAGSELGADSMAAIVDSLAAFRGR